MLKRKTFKLDVCNLQVLVGATGHALHLLTDITGHLGGSFDLLIDSIGGCLVLLIQLLLSNLERTLRLACSGIGGFLCLSGGSFCVTVCLVLQVGCSLTDLGCGVATSVLGVLKTLGCLGGQISSSGLGGVGHTCKTSSPTQTEVRKSRRELRSLPTISYIQARLVK